MCLCAYLSKETVCQNLGRLVATVHWFLSDYDYSEVAAEVVYSPSPEAITCMQTEETHPTIDLQGL